MAKARVENVLTWGKLKSHLENLLTRVRNAQDDATGEEALKLIGEARVLKKLMNLPETLALIDAEDRRVLEEANHAR